MATRTTLDRRGVARPAAVAQGAITPAQARGQGDGVGLGGGLPGDVGEGEAGREAADLGYAADIGPQP